MSLLGWLSAGAAGAWLTWAGGRRWWRQRGWQRVNFRGASVSVAGGVALVLPVVVLAAAHGRSRIWASALVAAAGFGGLGLIDDLAGDRPQDAALSGFRGHLASLARGRVTTGALKLAGGAVTALGASALWHRGFGWWTVADAALIALVANLANLLDRAPGRAGKVALLAGALLMATAARRVPAPLAATTGAAAALLFYDLRERLMLGDTGANALGALIGLGVVQASGGAVRLGVLIAAAVLNALSEIISFSAVIARVPLLRALDQAGRRR